MAHIKLLFLFGRENELVIVRQNFRKRAYLVNSAKKWPKVMMLIERIDNGLADTCIRREILIHGLIMFYR